MIMITIQVFNIFSHHPAELFIQCLHQDSPKSTRLSPVGWKICKFEYNGIRPYITMNRERRRNIVIIIEL